MTYITLNVKSAEVTVALTDSGENDLKVYISGIAAGGDFVNTAHIDVVLDNFCAHVRERIHTAMLEKRTDLLERVAEDQAKASFIEDAIVKLSDPTQKPPEPPPAQDAERVWDAKQQKYIDPPEDDAEEPPELIDSKTGEPF